MNFFVQVKIYAPYPIESSHKRRIESYSLTIKKI